MAATEVLGPRARERIGRLDRIWEERPGIVGWLTTVDHKRIGILYFFTTLAFFGAGGVEALLMRTQLSSGGAPTNSPMCDSKDSTERAGRPSGESWRCREKMSGGRGGHQCARCRKTCRRGAKRTKIVGMSYSTPKLALW